MTTDKLTLSVVIPAYNEELHLGDCLDSIAKQTEMPNQVIVVDNNSTDKTAEIAKKYPFVTLINEKKQGVTHARNRGFDIAKGDIIGRIDADSVLEKDWAWQVKKIFKDKTVAAATGPTHFYDMPLSPDNYVFDHAFKASLHKFDKKFPFLFGTNMAIRRSAWQKVKGDTCIDKRIHEDIDLAIHLHKAGFKIKYSQEMRAGMSARRYDDRPKDFYKYVSMMKSSYDLHGLKPVGPHVAIAGFGLGYLVLWPLRRSYDPISGKRTLRQFLSGHKARKHPDAS